MKYDKKDIPQFQKEVCLCDCIMKGKCIEEGKDDNWFLVCPKFFNWKIGYTSFVIEQLKWEREHPEEAEEKYKKSNPIKNIFTFFGTYLLSQIKL